DRNVTGVQTCALPILTTGYGAAKNAAGVQAGDRVAVLGIGGVGVNAIQAAQLLGAAEVVGIDVNAEREAVAKQFGADRFALAGEIGRASCRERAASAV